MHYRQRILLAALCSCGINLAVLMLPWPRAAMVDGAHRSPLVFHFVPAAEPETAPRTVPLVVETRPTEQPPPPDTPLLSDRDSAAADRERYDGEDFAPRFEEQDTHYELPSPSVLPEAVAAPPVTPTEPAEAESRPVPARAPEREAPEAAREEDRGDLLALAAPSAPGQPAPRLDRAPVQAPEPRTAVQPPPAPSLPSRGRGNIEGMAVEEGIASFAALRDEVAAYVLEIKPLVQREWLALLLTRYSGTSPTEAVVRLAIAPDGAIAGLEFAEAPRDRIYAALCQEAIRRAGPFKPFPFRIPREYRDEHLVIRWTFRFL